MKKILFGNLILLLCLLVGCAGSLHRAAERGDIRAINEILDRGADIQRQAYSARVEGSPLHYASAYCQIGAVKILLERGADINAFGYDSSTALYYAVRGGCRNVAMLLIARGANTDMASGLLTRNNRKSEAGMLDAWVRESQTGNPAIAGSKETRPAILPTDIDQPPIGLSAPQKDAYAVVIGIENYRSLPKSDYSWRDAMRVKSYLKELGYRERNIEFITNEKATKTDMEKSLEAWLPGRAQDAATVLVYFSGHGAPEPATGDAYLVPYDGDPNYLPVTGYSLKRLYEALGKLEAKEVIVVLDSCFSGAGGRSVLARGARPLVMMTTTATLPSNIVVLSATRGSQISTSSPDKGYGVFTYHFLKAIKDGKKNVADIYEQIVPQVEDEAKKLNVEQSPSISPEMEKLKGKFSLRK